MTDADSGTSSPSRRLDIQGLRGLPVIPTLIYHMTNATLISGGIIFLDMFFTVSGFLITGRLIHLARTRGLRTYFYEFYKFRARRLFPAAIFTIVVTAVLARVLMVPARAQHVTGDAFSALFFFANVRFASQGTDYMHRTTATSPLLPFWSLSVEEQFYLVWPVVMLIAIVLVIRRGRGGAGRLAAVCLAIGLASFAYGMWFTHAHRVAAYYSTFSRAWDFAFGALLAVYAARHRLAAGVNGMLDAALNEGAPRRRRGLRVLIDRLRDVLNHDAGVVGWIGVLCFAVGTFTTPTGSGFPVPWAGVGVIGAGLVIFAGIDQRRSNWLLENRAMVWLGDVSYSFYVVHFPVMIFAALYLSGSHAVLYTFDVVATATATVLVYYFVEEPGRRGFRATGAWLRAGGHRGAVNVIAVTGALATIIFAVGLGSSPVSSLPAAPHGDLVTDSTGAPSATTAPAASSALIAPAPADDPDAVVPAPGLRAALVAALGSASFSGIANAERIDNPGSYLGACWYVDPAKPPCVATPPAGTDPRKVAVALGDSTMVAYWPMLKAALVPRGWTVVMFVQRDCPAMILSRGAGFGPECQAYYADYDRVFAAWSPSVVLMANSEYDLLGMAAGDGGQVVDADVRAAYASAARTTIAAVARRGAKALIVSPPPVVGPAQVPGSCIARGAPAQNCTYAPSQSWVELDRANRAAARAGRATYADTESLFCVARHCPGAVGDLVVHADRNHITPEYAARVAPDFARYLVEKGVVE